MGAWIHIITNKIKKQELQKELKYKKNISEIKVPFLRKRELRYNQTRDFKNLSIMLSTVVLSGLQKSNDPNSSVAI